MTRTRQGRLPRLTTPGDHERLRENSPADLKGSRYAKLGANNLGDTDDRDFLPVLPEGECHPQPYYRSEEVTFPPVNKVPWREDDRNQIQGLLETWDSDERLRDVVVADFLNDLLQDEVNSISSGILTDSQFEEETDKESVRVLEEELLQPEVEHLVYLTVWSLLFEVARSLPPDDYLELQKKEHLLMIDDVARQALLAHVLEGDCWADDLSEEKILSGVKWDNLVYHYYTHLAQSGLVNNVALHLLQERFIIQAVGEVLLTEGLLDALNEDLNRIDEQEKVADPPRRG